MEKPIRHRMFERAFRLCRSRLWEELEQRDIFAVEFSDDTLGYVSLEGCGDLPEADCIPPSENRMYLFRGEEGIRSVCLLRVLNDMVYGTGDVQYEDRVRLKAEYVLKVSDFLSRQDCVILRYIDRNKLSSSEFAEAFSAMVHSSISLSDYRSLPFFCRYNLGDEADGLSEHDRKYMPEALEAVYYLSNKVGKRVFGRALFDKLSGSGKIPVLRKDRSVGMMDFPVALPLQWKGAFTPSLAARAARLRQDDAWLCATCLSPVEVTVEGVKAPCCMFLFVYSYGYDTPMFTVVMDCTDEQRTVFSADGLLGEMKRMKMRPEIIYARDQRTCRILSDMCDRCGIELSGEHPMPDMDLFLTDFMERDFGRVLNIPCRFSV